jgi:hypothetical protein
MKTTERRQGSANERDDRGQESDCETDRNDKLAVTIE